MTRALALALLLVPCTLAAQAAPARSAGYEGGWVEVPLGGASARPRDPYMDAKGRVWFAGQQGDYVAYMEPATRRWRQYEITPGTHPHNVVVEKGMVWFTGNRNGRLVKLDPESGKLTTYMIPDSTVRDPHTMVFDPKSGVAWFTAQNSDAVGRFDPATGRFAIVRTGARTRPYGIALDSRGRPWFDLFGTNRIAMIDPATMKVEEHVLPDAGSHPRRIAITSDDHVWWGDYTRGFLGHLDPRTGRMDEVALPAGAASMPYGMAVDDRDVVWVAQNGSATAPATLVGFDPRARKFVAEVPVGTAGPNTVRHMTFDRRTRQLWYGTDQGTIGHVAIPGPALVP